MSGVETLACRELVLFACSNSLACNGLHRVNYYFAVKQTLKELFVRQLSRPSALQTLPSTGSTFEGGTEGRADCSAAFLAQ